MNICYVVLTKIFNLSITGSIAVLVVLALRFLLRKAPSQFSYMLWAIVLFRLLCPFSVSSPVSLWNLADISVRESGELEYISTVSLMAKTTAETDSTVAEESMTAAETDSSVTGESMTEAELDSNVRSSGTDKDKNVLLESVIGKDNINHYQQSQNMELVSNVFRGLPIAVWFAVWLLGVGGMACYGILSALRLNRQLKCSMCIRENIYLADGIETPFVFGVLQPKIYLPSGLGEQEQHYIILHEQYHILRKDYLFRPVAFAALCLHWFNPFAWLAFVLSGKDMEMSCDEAVMKKEKGDIRSEYASSLLSLASGRKRITGVPLTFGESDTKSRIKNVINYKKTGIVILVAAVMVVAVGTVCLVTNPVTANPAKNAQLSNRKFPNAISQSQENISENHYQQITMEEEKAIEKAIIENNNSGHADEYDFSCCNYINLQAVSCEKVGQQTVAYYGWAYYGEYKFLEDGMEEVGGYHVPVALTFGKSSNGYRLQEYWEPGDGDDFYDDIRRKFPADIAAEAAAGRQKFVLEQVQDCYAQAIAYGGIDMEPIIEYLLEVICTGMPEESSAPQDYISAHDGEYRELSYYCDYTVDYCVSRFEAGFETGLEGHIMARIIEGLLGTKGKLPLNAEEAPNGQEWYESLKTNAPNLLEKYCGLEKEPAVMELGIPVSLPENPNWIQNRVLKQSDERHFEMQYYDSILEGQCTLWAVKDGEINLPELGEQDWAEETWQGSSSSGQNVYVNVKSNEKWALAEWEYQGYRFAILGEISVQEADISPVPKTALNVIMYLQ